MQKGDAGGSSSSDKDGKKQASDDTAPAQDSSGGGGNDEHQFSQSSGVSAEPNEDARFQVILSAHPSVITVTSLTRLRALTATRLTIILDNPGLSNDESADLAILAETPAGTCSLLAAVVCCRGSTHSHSTHILNLYHHHTLFCSAASPPSVRPLAAIIILPSS
jgi:hypothetical protein